MAQRITFRLRRAARATTAVVITALTATPAAAQSATVAPCRPVSHEGNGYVVCEADLTRQTVELYWKRANDVPYGQLTALAREMAVAGKPLAFAMNAGMYHADLTPVGHYVEGAKERVRINTRSGPGNFHLKPNGVFFIAGDRAGVMETDRYLKARPRATFATQSGPMLVIDGELHPAFTPAGQSRKIRNGVGEASPTRIVFAISDGGVTFSEFARLFRDHLGARNALFLDGTISSLYAPALGRSDTAWPVGPIVGVSDKRP